MDKVQTGKFISRVLRHSPQTIGIELDKNGWADVAELIAGLNRKGHSIDMAGLEDIVATNNKKRYSFNEDKTKIRANQGHSVDVDLELKAAVPPDVLFHGTADRFIEGIKENGLQKQNRNHVHLSADWETAESVGKRHGRPVVLVIEAGKMRKDGYVFYLSENGVWLTGEVPSGYIRFEEARHVSKH